MCVCVCVCMCVCVYLFRVGHVAFIQSIVGAVLPVSLQLIACHNPIIISIMRLHFELVS